MELLVVGLFIVIVGGLTVRDVLRLRAWPSATATVVDNIHDPLAGEGSGGMYKTVVEYRTSDGRVVRSSDGSWSGRPAYATGSQVTVRYDAARPDQVVVGRKSTVIFGAVTVFLIVFFAFLAVR